jgi:type V secretory pathway adhesin AidA
MRRAALGLGTMLAVSFTGPAAGETIGDEIQNSEQPGSEINFTFGGGGVQARRANGGPIFGGLLGGTARSMFGVGSGVSDGSLDLPPDPDFPLDSDAVDNELPGEGPESLSGPDDEDTLPE